MLKQVFKNFFKNKQTSMNVTLSWKNIDLTSKQKQYIEEKIRSLSKFFNNITRARIDVGVESTKHNKGKIFYAHVNLHVPGKVLRVEELEPSVEKAIDKAKDDLQIELKKYKARFNKKGSESIKNLGEDLSGQAMYYEADMNQGFNNDSGDSDF